MALNEDSRRDPDSQPDPISFRVQPSEVPVHQQRGHIAVKTVSEAGWFRAHPDPEHTGIFQVLEHELSSKRKVEYLVLPGLADEHDARHKRLVTCVNRGDRAFLLKLSVPSPGAPENPYVTTGLEVAEAAKNEWVRGYNPGGHYDIKVAPTQGAEPKFPEETLDELVMLAFKGRLITDYDHELLKQARGEL